MEQENKIPLLRKKVEIQNKKGLHARASARLVREVEPFCSQASIHYQGQSADLRSILDLLTLGAAKGAIVEITAQGKDADPLLKAVTTLIQRKFDEPE